MARRGTEVKGETRGRRSRTRTDELRRAREEAARRSARRRRTVMAVGGLVIAALVAAIIVAVVRVAGGGDTPEATTGQVVAPGNLTSTGAIPVGAADAPVTVEIYYDYMCPACGAFESANVDELDKLVDDGTAKLELRPIAFLDEQSNGTEYSTRTANAIATVVDGAPTHVWAFHKALYAHQPEEGTDGLTDGEIADLATSAGVPSGVVAKFADRTYEPWVAAVTQDAFDSGIKGTPTVLVNGKAFTGDLYTTGPLTDAVRSAAGQ